MDEFPSARQALLRYTPDQRLFESSRERKLGKMPFPAAHELVMEVVRISYSEVGAVDNQLIPIKFSFGRAKGFELWPLMGDNPSDLVAEALQYFPMVAHTFMGYAPPPNVQVSASEVKQLPLVVAVQFHTLDTLKYCMCPIHETRRQVMPAKLQSALSTRWVEPTGPASDDDQNERPRG